MVASVVAAEKDNEICAAGIAYNATILAFKVFKMENSSHNNNSVKLQLVTDGHILSSALVHRLNNIDIFVNAWYPIILFDGLDSLTLDAIKRGATTGRGGLGIIYVVPSGIQGNALSNNIYTVTVGGVGINGSLMSDIHSFVDASILVSALAEGNNLTSAKLFTTSYQDHCISSFKGLSAATSIIGGIIALGLQANDKLSLRDVEHLLVNSAERDCLTESDNFKPNGADIFYHDCLEFGLINASKFVEYAIKSSGFPTLLEKRLNMKQDRDIDTQTSKINEVEFCYHCQNLYDEDCITSVEHVSASVAMKVDTRELSVRIQSPSGTESILLQKINLHSEVNGTFVSTHFWNEVPIGKWKIVLNRERVKDTLQNVKLSLILYGFYDKQKSSRGKVFSCEEKSMITDKGTSDRSEETNRTSVNNIINTTNINIFVIPGVVGGVVVFLCVVFCQVGLCRKMVIHYDLDQCVTPRNNNQNTNSVLESEKSRLLKKNNDVGIVMENQSHADIETKDTGLTLHAAGKEFNCAGLNATNNLTNKDRKLCLQLKENEDGSKIQLSEEYEEYEELV